MGTFQSFCTVLTFVKQQIERHQFQTCLPNVKSIGPTVQEKKTFVGFPKCLLYKKIHHGRPYGLFTMRNKTCKTVVIYFGLMKQWENPVDFGVGCSASYRQMWAICDVGACGEWWQLDIGWIWGVCFQYNNRQTSNKKRTNNGDEATIWQTFFLCSSSILLHFKMSKITLFLFFMVLDFSTTFSKKHPVVYTRK